MFYLSLHREICYNREWERVSRNEAGGEEGIFPCVTPCPPYFWKGRLSLWRIKIRNRSENEKRRPSRTSKRRRRPAKRRRQRRARLLLSREASARTRSTEALADEGAWGQQRSATFVCPQASFHSRASQSPCTILHKSIVLKRREQNRSVGPCRMRSQNAFHSLFLQAASSS